MTPRPWWGWLLVGIWLTLGVAGAQGFSDETGTGWEDWYDALTLRYGGGSVVVEGEIVSGARRRRALLLLPFTLLRLLVWTAVVIVLSPPLILCFGLLSGVLFAASRVRPER